MVPTLEHDQICSTSLYNDTESKTGYLVSNAYLYNLYIIYSIHTGSFNNFQGCRKSLFTVVTGRCAPRTVNAQNQRPQDLARSKAGTHRVIARESSKPAAGRLLVGPDFSEGLLVTPAMTNRSQVRLGF